MLVIRVGDGVYELGEASSAELLQRLEPTAPLEGGEPAPGSVHEKLRDPGHSRAAADLDDADLALIGVVLEAWTVEVDGDIPADVRELRSAIAAHLD